MTWSATPLRAAFCPGRGRGWGAGTTRPPPGPPPPRADGPAPGGLPRVRTGVGMPREDAAADRSAPLPGGGSLPALVEQFRSAGADVTLTVEGDIAGLPATTGLAVYRIAQEALTNAAKHAPGAPTEVRLRVFPGEVTLTADTRAAPVRGPGPDAGPGLGVISM